MNNKKRVLLVEDDTQMRDFYKDFLANQYNVEVAADGEEGWLKLINGRPDLIILDIMMPKLDGLGFLQRKSKDTQFSKVPAIMLTNLGQEKILKKCFELGAKCCILKAETTPDQILPIIEKALVGV